MGLKIRFLPLMSAFILLLFAGLLSSQTNEKASARVRIGVLDFTAKGSISSTEASIASDIFRQEIANSATFDVLDRKNMQSILSEQEFQQSGCTETACAVKIGKLLNMQYMISGMLLKLGSSYYISAEMVNVETSRIEKTGRQKMESLDQLEKGIRDLVEEISGEKRTQKSQAVEEFTVGYEGLYIGAHGVQYFDPDFQRICGFAYGVDSFIRFRLFGFDKDVLKWTGYFGVEADVAFANASALAKNSYYIFLEPYLSPFLGLSIRIGFLTIALGAEVGMPMLYGAGILADNPYSLFTIAFGAGASALIGIKFSESFKIFVKGKANLQMSSYTTAYWSISAGIHF